MIFTFLHSGTLYSLKSIKHSPLLSRNTLYKHATKDLVIRGVLVKITENILELWIQLGTIILLQN